MNDSTKGNEIDLFEIFQIIWEGKWKIIAFMSITSLVGIFFIFSQKESFSTSVQVKSSKPSVFIEFTSLNSILSENNLKFQINEKSVFKLFERKMTDNQEIKNILKKNKFIQQQIVDSDEIEKDKLLLEYSSMFEITEDKEINILKDQINRVVSFKWHDPNEGRFIVKEVLLEILENLKKSIINDINILAEAINDKQKRELNELKIRLSEISQNEAKVLERRILFLLEQSEIAKSLGIMTNSLDANALSQSEKISINLFEDFVAAPFFLRGYDAIYKEIELLNDRSDDEKLLMADGYLELKSAIRMTESRLEASYLLNSLKTFETSNSKDLIDINLSLIKSESQTQSMLILFISLLLGGVASTTYVLVSHAIRNHRKKIEKAQ